VSDQSDALAVCGTEKATMRWRKTISDALTVRNYQSRKGK
jgi:hypothetical protein